MTKKAISSLDKTIDRIGYWHGTWKLISDNWQALSVTFLFYGASIAAAAFEIRRYAVMIMANTHWIVNPVLIAVSILSLFGFAIGVLLVSRWLTGKTAIGHDRDFLPKEPEEKAIRSLLRLQFHGGQKFPTEIENENIHSWFAYRTAQAQIRATNPEGKEIVAQEIPPNWVIQIVFESDVEYKEIDINFPSNNEITAQVYGHTERSILIATNDDLPVEQMEIRTKF